MEYIDVLWVHEHKDEPVRLVSELDADRFERRRLEFFADGTVHALAGDRIFEGTVEIAPLPALHEINQDAQFKGRAIAAGEFEDLWHAYA